MKKIRMLVIAILGLALMNSCKKENESDSDSNVTNPVPTGSLKPEKTDVKTYEIINLTVAKNLADKYIASFGSQSIELLKTSDSTLTFLVPEIAPGNVTLKCDLGTINFNILKTSEISTNQLFTSLNQNFDWQIGELQTSTPDQTQDINRIIQYKQEVVSMWNSLTDEQKRQAGLFYEANKEIFKTFSNSAYSILDASTTMKSQSTCPRTDFKTFYGCTAENLGDAANGLKLATKKFLEMVGMAGAMAGVAYSTSVLGPVAWGITAVGISLPAGAAAYLLVMEIAPAAAHLKQALIPFLEANWIFSKALFISAAQVFSDQAYINMNLMPKFRSLTASDGNVNSGSAYFINAMISLKENWNKLTAVFGNFPSFRNKEESATLSSTEVSISNISNSNVQYLGNNGQAVKFKSLSGKEEKFSYTIKVNKQGFSEEKTISATLSVVTDFQLTGYWRLNFYSDESRTNLGQSDLINFQNGKLDRGLPDPFSGDNKFTWNQNFSPSTQKLSLTHNYWNVLYQFTYDKSNPNVLIGESIGASNNGFNLELVKQ